MIESSTSSAKAMLYDPACGVVELRTEPYPASCRSGETGCQNAEQIFQKTVDLGRQVAQGRRIDAVVPCATWHNVLVCTGEMEPVAPALTWAYPGAAPAAARLRQSESFTNDFYRRTGCMVHAIYPVFKLIQMQQDGMDMRDACISSQGSYTFYRLTGCRLVSDCTASGTGLLNVHTRQWDPQALGLARIRQEQLGDVASFREVRSLSVQGARLLGLPQGTPVLPSHPDGALNQVGAGALEPGIMTFSVGTSGALRLSAARPVLPQKPSTWCYLTPDAWLSGAATSGACNCVDWIKRLLFPPESSYRDLDMLPADEEQMPLFLPFLFGERCPGWHDSWQGGFSGLSPGHSKGDLYRSVLEGVLFNLYQCFQMLCQVNGEPKAIQLSGGILHSPVWRQMCCDIFGRELACSDATHASMLGGAVLGLAATGQLGQLKDFRASVSETLQPDPARHERFRRRFEQYLLLYRQMEQNDTEHTTA